MAPSSGRCIELASRTRAVDFHSDCRRRRRRRRRRWRHLLRRWAGPGFGVVARCAGGYPGCWPGGGLILGGRWGRRWREEFFRELNESKTCCDDDSLKRANQATEFLFPSFFFRPLFIHSFSILVFVIRLHSFFLLLSSFFSPLLPFSLSFYFWFFFDGISFDCGAGCGGGGGGGSGSGGFYNGRARHCPILFNYPIQWLHFIMTFNYSALSFLALPPSTSLLSFLSK